MPASTITRLTSKDLVIEYRPGNAAPGTTAAHVQKLLFDTTVTGGTYKLWINGVPTSAITWSAGSSTHGTAIKAAIEAITTGVTWTVTKVSDYEYTLTAGTSNLWYLIRIHDQTSLTGGFTRTYYTTAGTQTYTLQGEASVFGYSETSETTETTPIASLYQTQLETKRSAKFDISLYAALSSWEYVLYDGGDGLLVAYEQGKVTGSRYVGMYVLLKSVDRKNPDHDKIEITVSGDRQGDYIYQPNTIY